MRKISYHYCPASFVLEVADACNCGRKAQGHAYQSLKINDDCSVAVRLLRETRRNHSKENLPDNPQNEINNEKEANRHKS